MALQVIKGNTLLLWITNQSHQTEWKREYGKKIFLLHFVYSFLGICLKFSPMFLFLFLVLCFFLFQCVFYFSLASIWVDFSLFRLDFFSLSIRFFLFRSNLFPFGRFFPLSLFLSFFSSLELLLKIQWNWRSVDVCLNEILSCMKCIFWYRLSVSQLLSHLKALSHVEKVKTWKIQEEKKLFLSCT